MCFLPRFPPVWIRSTGGEGASFPEALAVECPFGKHPPVSREGAVGSRGGRDAPVRTLNSTPQGRGSRNLGVPPGIGYIPSDEQPETPFHMGIT